ncbi:HAD family hydrolase [Noviherbaspirillum galbum]|uniref:HAD-IA family hydrolase n=1 Tax=Noviherbaspirillum galbum TaxID=2709383 RepID=A0A6B3SMS8_9BURK|nr:HAD-IA family hydrolase [Noviherbaspirillum galbum]NEX60625.1 HAD-IA family hydrolase [Noviherbaspirillum galbum]
MPLSIPRAVLFDLDGTLADTAPDLAAAMNAVRASRGLDPAPYELLRPVASAGARGLIGAAFGLKPGDDGYEELRVAFLDQYETNIAVHTCLFQGIPALLGRLQHRGVTWGIVTNKASRFTDKLVPLISLGTAPCVVSGDTTPHSKPHPEPLLEAARRLDIDPMHCWYVGDDLRDVQAGRAAGMVTVAAAWGYCGNVEPVSWDADALAATPADLLQLIDSLA